MLAALVLSALIAPLASYADPGGAFAFDLPEGWTARREQVDVGLYYTQTFKQGQEDGAHIDVLVQQVGSEIPESSHAEVNGIMLDTILQVLAAENSITKQNRTATTWDGRKAARIDLEYRDEDGALWNGWVVAVTGKTHAIAVLGYAKSSDPTGLKLAETHASTFAIESRTPRKAGPVASGGFISKESLGSLAGKIPGNMKREPASKILVPGDPPLTYGSVANFVNVIEILFDIQLTESEFDATRARFLEYYAKADPEGKQILAAQGASLLQTLTTGTQAERDQSRAEGKAVFENAFKRGAEMGMGYAQVMWEAISRRSTSLASAKQAPNREDWDANISEGDLDATMEMLYFMWVGAGRDASDVTMEDIFKIRMQIVQGLPEMDPQLQLLIANAPKIYAGIRQQWAAAAPQARAVMAQQFSAALDEWGIGAQSSFDTSSGGGGSSEYSMNAQIAQNTAWNAAKTW